MATTQRNPTLTPDNTPVPGGGSWKWSESLPGWVSNDPAPPLASPTPVSEPVATPTPSPTKE